MPARFFDLVLSYPMSGRASEAGQYRVPAATTRLLSIIMQSAQAFVTGVDGEHVSRSPWSMTLEGLADRFGFELTLAIMKKAGYDLYFTYWGVELFLYANEIMVRDNLERVSGRPRCGKARAYPPTAGCRDRLPDELGHVGLTGQGERKHGEHDLVEQQQFPPSPRGEKASIAHSPAKMT